MLEALLQSVPADPADREGQTLWEDIQFRRKQLDRIEAMLNELLGLLKEGTHGKK